MLNRNLQKTKDKRVQQNDQNLIIKMKTKNLIQHKNKYYNVVVILK